MGRIIGTGPADKLLQNAVLLQPQVGDMLLCFSRGNDAMLPHDCTAVPVRYPSDFSSYFAGCKGPGAD